jgi:exosortase A
VSGTLAAAPAGSPARSLRPALLSLAIAVLVFAVLFHTEVEAAVSVWIASTAFGHCFLVLPIALYLAWERREAFTRLLAAGATPQPQRRPLLGLIPLAVAWLIAELLGIMEGRQLMALSMLEVLAYALLGPVLWRCMAVPLLYLFFLVPFGAFLTPALQSFTVHFIDAGLGLLGIPHVVSNTVIEIPAGSFLVAEACAGLRFLIASIAFGVLYACTIYRSPDRRIAFIAASIVVPILANGLRALGIVVLGEVLGSAQAAAVDHLVYGWLFFTVVTLALILAGLPFREDRLPPPVLTPFTRRPRAAAPAAMVAGVGVMLAAIGPAAAAWIGHDAGGPGTHVRLDFVVPPGCVQDQSSAEEQDITCGDAHLAIRALLFSPASSPQILLEARRALAGPGEVVATSQIPAGANRAWLLTQTAEPSRTYALGFWATAQGSGGTGPIWRLKQALAGMTTPSGHWRPLVAVVAISSPQPAVTLRWFLEVQAKARPGALPLDPAGAPAGSHA